VPSPRKHRGELLRAKLIGVLDHDHERLGAGAGATDHPLHLLGVLSEHLRRGHRQHHLPRARRIQSPLLIGLEADEDDLIVIYAAWRALAQAALELAALRQFDYQFGIAGDPRRLPGRRLLRAQRLIVPGHSAIESVERTTCMPACR
jgi:hypothetical protein